VILLPSILTGISKSTYLPGYRSNSRGVRSKRFERNIFLFGMDCRKASGCDSYDTLSWASYWLSFLNGEK